LAGRAPPAHVNAASSGIPGGFIDQVHLGRILRPGSSPMRVFPLVIAIAVAVPPPA
jgi:hypothetical protein